jgi:hypothetical protein
MESAFASLAPGCSLNWARCALAYGAVALGVVALAEQFYMWWRRRRHGHDVTLCVAPFLRALVRMARSRDGGGWERLRTLMHTPAAEATHGADDSLLALLWSTLAAFVTDPDVARRVLMQTAPGEFSMLLHPSGLRVRTARALV